MTAKQAFLEKAAKKQQKNPKTAPKIISFSLAMTFLALSIVFMGIIGGLREGGSNIAKDVMLTICAIFSMLCVQGAVVCSALGVTSSKYAIHCISCASLSVSIAFEILHAIYFIVVI